MQLEELNTYGFDPESGLTRCLNDKKLYSSLLSLFLHDTAFSSAEAAIGQQNYTAAFDCLHDLKGISGNLGMTALYNATSVLVEALRGGRPPAEPLQAQLSALKEAYTLTCNGIRRLLSAEA